MKDLSNEIIVHKKKGEIEYIQFRKLLEYPEIQHCYTTRIGLDFRKDKGDNLIKESYKKICTELKIDEQNIVKPHQTHTDRIERVDEKVCLNEVDGIITNKKGIVLATTSADCTSLLFYDPVKKVIGSVHSGWRGTLKKIGQKTVLKMKEEYGCEPKNIICCICPHIRKCHFEVEDDVQKLFMDEFSYLGNIDEIIEKTEIIDGKQKYHIDTTLINKMILEEVGIDSSNIYDSGLCTVCKKDIFHSYRVDREESGRNSAIITLV